MFINPDKKEMLKKQEEVMKRMIQQYLKKITDDTLKKVFVYDFDSSYHILALFRIGGG